MLLLVVVYFVPFTLRGDLAGSTPTPAEELNQMLQASSSEDDADESELDCTVAHGELVESEDSGDLSQRLDGVVLDLAALAAGQAANDRTLRLLQPGSSASDAALPQTFPSPISPPDLSAVVAGLQEKLGWATTTIRDLHTDRSTEQISLNEQRGFCLS